MKREVTDRELNLVYKHGSSKLLLALSVLLTVFTAFFIILTLKALVFAFVFDVLFVVTDIALFMFYNNCTKNVKSPKPFKSIRVVLIVVISLLVILLLLCILVYPIIAGIASKFTGLINNISDNPDSGNAAFIPIFFLGFFVNTEYFIIAFIIISNAIFLALLFSFLLFVNNVINILDDEDYYRPLAGIIFVVIMLLITALLAFSSVRAIVLDLINIESFSIKTSILRIIIMSLSLCCFGGPAYLMLRFQLDLKKKIDIE